MLKSDGESAICGCSDSVLISKILAHTGYTFTSNDIRN